MNIARGLATALGVLAMSAPALAGQAGTAMQAALDSGAERLGADRIAERFVGQTGTWISADGSKKIAIHYGEDNSLDAEMVGGDWSGTGFYGVADDDAICVSWDGADEGRLRCLDVLLVDGVVTKFNADGSLNGTYADFVEGRAF